jgi:hypothetical protein
VAIALVLVLWACAGPRRNVATNNAACEVLTKTLSDQEEGFVTLAQHIRAEHVVLREYDRRMIVAIIERRKTLQATRLTELSVSDDVAGCSGQQLEDLRYRAMQEMANLRDFLNDFNRALKSDPAGIFIDEP